MRTYDIENVYKNNILYNAWCDSKWQLWVVEL